MHKQWLHLFHAFSYGSSQYNIPSWMYTIYLRNGPYTIFHVSVSVFTLFFHFLKSVVNSSSTAFFDIYKKNFISTACDGLFYLFTLDNNRIVFC
jgi:hypothetical protein